ncbi:MAG: eukaryotic-like serine/threonine-protein kinase [Chthoniobacter sp.]|jgi:tRNA A-37 threonylcarbamoyl transferase component Bud32|nr:eukaryotic-like serine/threonine-protein kinase [Chthoniobacter sp.]
MAGPTLNYEHFQIETDGNGTPVELDSTGVGITYRAYDTRLRKTVALKIVNRELLADENNRKRFLNEARAAAALDHPNIARVIHLCPVDAPEFYYAMELVDGESLAQRIEREGPLPVAEALRALRPLTDVLIVLGNHRLVHRDIQPANIILTVDSQGAPTVKLIEFGLAKFIGTHAGMLDVVQTAELRASSVYNLSPEQIHGNTPIDSRADFYSLGVTLWTALTGKPPFVGSPYEVNEGHLHGEVRWSDLPEMPESVRVMIERLLAKNPSDRPADARALCTLWDGAIRSLEAATTPSARRVKKAPATPSPAPARPSAKPSAPQLRRLGADPEGCSEPSPVGYLAEKEAGQGLFFVRRIPERLAEPLRTEFLKAAAASLAHPHATLLNVCDILPSEVVSVWHKGITVARLLAIRHNEIPAEMIRGWLPSVAQAVDWAREHGVLRANFAPTTWLVEYLDLADGESPLDRAMREPDKWGKMAVWIDPLAGFDPVLMTAAATPDETLLPGRTEPMTTSAGYLAAFARAVQEIFGGHHQRHEAPLATVNEACNALLFDAIKGKSKFANAHDWMAAFLACDQDGSPPAAPAPPLVRVASPNAPAIKVAIPTARVAGRSTSPATAKRPKSFFEAIPLPVRLGAGVLALLLVIGLIGWRVAGSRPKVKRVALATPPPAANEEGRRLLSLAEKMFAEKNFGGAKAFLAEARRETGTGPQAAELVPQFDALARRIEAADVKATQADDTEARIASATKAKPFENRFGMKFVPIPLSGAAADGRKVLFATTETRVVDFQKFVKTGPWQRQAFQDSDEHPAVGVVPADVNEFCRWLNKHYKLPGKWQYRLPSDQEWTCAAGFGPDESADPKKKPAAAGRYPWGSAWPPPAGSANVADTTFLRLPGSVELTPPTVKGYNDGYAGTAPVGKFRPNEFGLYDMAGNAAEWCFDAKGYLLRGGSFCSSQQAELQIASRGFGSLDERKPMNGFRLVISDVSPPMPDPSASRPAGDVTGNQAGGSGSASAASAVYSTAGFTPTGQVPGQAHQGNAQQAGQVQTAVGAGPGVQPVTTIQGPSSLQIGH